MIGKEGQSIFERQQRLFERDDDLAVGRLAAGEQTATDPAVGGGRSLNFELELPRLGPRVTRASKPSGS